MVNHEPTPEFFLNVYSIHNYTHIFDTLPESLHVVPLRVPNVQDTRKTAVQQLQKKRAGKAGMLASDKSLTPPLATSGMGSTSSGQQSAFTSNATSLPVKKGRGSKRRGAQVIAPSTQHISATSETSSMTMQIGQSQFPDNESTSSLGASSSMQALYSSVAAFRVPPAPSAHGIPSAAPILTTFSTLHSHSRTPSVPSQSEHPATQHLPLYHQSMVFAVPPLQPAPSSLPFFPPDHLSQLTQAPVQESQMGLPGYYTESYMGPNSHIRSFLPQ